MIEYEYDPPEVIKNAQPISDEKLQELDRWYRDFTSISYEMTFCDADYWEMRKRLLIVEKEKKANETYLKEELRTACRYMKEGKRLLGQECTTNSLVDDFIKKWGENK